MMRVSTLWAICLASVVSLSPTAYAQQSRSLPDLIVGLTAAAIPGVNTPTYQTTTMATLRTVEPAIVVPNNVAASQEFSGSLDRFDQIPSLSSMAPSFLTFSAALKVVEGELEFSTRVLTDSERQQLRDAERVLYVGTDRTPSAEFAQYLEYEKTFNELLAQEAAETNPATRTSLRARITQTERDWELFGRRDDIKSALLRVGALATPDNESLLEQWRLIVAEPSSLTAPYVSSEMGKANWLRVSASSNELSDIVLKIEVKSSRISLPAIKRVALDVTMIQIPRPALQSALLLDRTWRLRSGAVLSDGNPDVDAPGELAPRVISALLLVKNLELSFTETLSNEAMAALTDGGKLTLGGISIPAASDAPRAFQADSLTIVGPVAVGARVEELAKNPNPDIGREWP